MKIPVLLMAGLGALAGANAVAAADPPAPSAAAKPLFDGRTLTGWEGSEKWWKVENGAISGGSLTEKVPRNEFIATRDEFGDFVLRLKIRLTGSEGFINSGVQIRSQRVPNSSEMSGYQCDFGDPTWWGSIYDESRRNKVLAQSDMDALNKVLKRGDWNDYVIRAAGPRITTWINGVQGVDYTEPDAAIPQRGRLGIQIHGGGKGRVEVKDITVEELPAAKPIDLKIEIADPAVAGDFPARAEKLIREWHPKIVALLGVDYLIPPTVTLRFREFDGIAHTSGATIDVSTKWTTKHPDDVGLVVHELVHVIQAYPRGSPGWLVEGIADYIRYFHLEPERGRRYKPAPNHSYRSGYLPSAAMLAWLQEQKKEPLIARLNARAHAGRMDRGTFEEMTGHTPAGAWQAFLTAKGFIGAPNPPNPPAPSPLVPAEQQKCFSLPPGFEIELVAAEEPGRSGKFVTTAWDARGRLWTMTALDYPVDGNESPEESKVLFAKPGRDQVLIFDFETRGAAGERPRYRPTPEVFADGLAIPLGLLPHGKGCLVQHGSEILFLDDTDGDGRADRREVVLDGFGTQDSHLFPHGFTRGPGGWIYMAQGAFNDGVVKAKDGSATRFRFCKMARFTPDGRRFEVVGAGLNNIWGFVIARDGTMFAQEANDLGYPVTEWQIGDNFPGIGDDRLKPYAPVRPAPVSDFQMGGTGLSGLALAEDYGTWPTPYGARDDQTPTKIFYLANPITNRIQAIAATKDRDHFKFTKLPDFVRCSDPWFRPIHLDFGPDGCLYITDWYNKIISHNEVPRDHPDRDKSRGRIWRVSHRSQTWREVPDLAALDPGQRAAIAATHPVARVARAATEIDASAVAGSDLSSAPAPAESLLDQIRRRSTDGLLGGIPAPAGDYDTQFRRYLMRWALEEPPHRERVAAMIATPEWKSLPPESRALGALAAEGPASAAALAEATGALGRPLQDEEWLKLIEFADRPEIASALEPLFGDRAAVAALVRLQTRIDRDRLVPFLSAAARRLFVTVGSATGAEGGSADDRAEALATALQFVGAYHLTEFEPAAAAVLTQPDPPAVPVDRILRTLRQLGSTRDRLFLTHARSPDAKIRAEAMAALVAVPDRLLSLWPELSALERRSALGSLTGSAAGARAVVAALISKSLGAEDLDAPAIEKMQAVLGADDPALRSLIESMAHLFRPVLTLDGGNDSWAGGEIALEGPFTVETWVRLDPGIGNEDGILGAPGVLDMNFFDGRFRVWTGGGRHDVIIAERPIAPNVWTHVAVTRDASGQFRIYLNGTLDRSAGQPDPRKFENLAIGRTNVPKGTAGAFTEFRIWNLCRSDFEIRQGFDRILEAGSAPGLVAAFSNNNWGRLNGGARIVRTTDFPPLMTPLEGRAVDEKFEKFRLLAGRGGDSARGRAVAAVCLGCHRVAGQGGVIGPDLSGAGAMGLEAVLRNLLSPNAAMEPGYRTYRVELKDGTLKEGFLAQETGDAVVLRLPGTDDQRIPQQEIRRAGFTRRSLMPENLLDAFTPDQVSDLFAFLMSLK